MKLLNPKPSTLSPLQSKIWDAVNSCAHSKRVISNRSGLCLATIDNYLIGRHEPVKSKSNDLLEAIQELKDIPPKFKWENNIKEVNKMRETKTLDEIGEHFGKTGDAIRSAIDYSKRRVA